MDGVEVPEPDEAMSAIASREVWPQYAQDVLRGRKLVSSDLFPDCLPDSPEIDEYLRKPAGFGRPAIAGPNDMIATRGHVSHAWNLAKNAYEDVERYRIEGPSGMSANQATPSDKRLRISSEFQMRYNHAMPLDGAQSDRTLNGISHLWEKRS